MFDNPRLQKNITEIEKTKTKIIDLQARLRELEAQRTDLENTEIISLFRSVDAAPQELAEFIKKYKSQTVHALSEETLAPSPAYNYQLEEEESSNDEE